MVWSGLLISCAIPAAISPSEASLLERSISLLRESLLGDIFGP